MWIQIDGLPNRKWTLEAFGSEMKPIHRGESGAWIELSWRGAFRVAVVIRHAVTTALLVLAVSCTKPKTDPGGVAPKKDPGGIEMAPHTSFVVGDFLVWQGQGVVRVEGTEDRNGKSYWVMKAVEVGTTMMIPTDTVENVVRRPVSRPDAERLVGLLRQQTGASDDRPWAVRFHENMVTLIKRPLAVQVNALHTLYRTAYAPTFGERKLIDTIERVVVGELAHVLGKNVDAMIAELRSGHPAFATNPPQGPISGTLAFATNSPQRPPEPKIAEPKAPIVLKNHTYLGKISSPSGSIVVGEATAPAKDTFLAQGKPGEWHAYVRDSSDDDEGGLVLIHADALGQQAKLLKNLVPIADLNVEGGTMAMISAEVRDSETFQEATMFPVSPIVQGSGCMVTTGGDGPHRLRGTKIADRFAALVVDF